MSAEPEIVADTYTGENIKTLKDAAHIRQNPDMYVGNTQTSGLHHLAYEIVYNSVDEALAGYCSVVGVTIHIDGSLSVSDDGRGIPVDTKPETGKSTLEEVLTIVGSSGKFDNAAYKVSAGLHGMGAKAVNALSAWMEAEVRRSGRVYKMEFEKGYATGVLQDIGPAAANATGTVITFKPDPEIFGELSFISEVLSDRFRELAFLNKGLHITLHDERDGRKESYKYDGGIAEFVTHLNQGERLEHPTPIYVHKVVDHMVEGKAQPISVEVALQYTNRDEELIRCFTNNAHNPVGGTHLSGFRTGLTRGVKTYGIKEKHFKEDQDLEGKDFRQGLTAIISIGHPDPHFEAQTKIKLNNPEVEGLTASVVYEALSEWFETNPKDAGRICKWVALAAEARIAAKKARDATIDRKKILSGGGLPGKLMDCSTRNRDESELFLVEGDSAGGSAEGGRDRHYQAVLPLRGKVLNVEKAREDKLLKNAEIGALIAAVGVDIGNVEDVARLRYGKIVILTDADVDGQHIRTLLLTFFFRQMRKLIEDGRVYVARPPLYKVTQKKDVRFVQTREEMSVELMTRGLADAKLEVVALGRGHGTDRILDAAGLKKVLPVLAEIETAVQILERRGHSLEAFLPKQKEGAFPVFHVRLGVRETYFFSQAEVEEYRVDQSKKLGRELVVSDAATAAGAKTAASNVVDASTEKPPADVEERFRFVVDEWHELRTLNRAALKLRDLGFELSDLIPLPRVAGREPLVRFRLTSGESTRELPHLRNLVGDIRRIGEKGLTITRFKGLGEMDPEELWETTLDPAKRTLMRVTLSDALQAEKMFRMLMGDEVEGRREFILRHRANVEDIDYGA